ncbi:hypothetical protein GEMRC1_000392 [Eukaryota sp. GEM-RC1]
MHIPTLTDSNALEESVSFKEEEEVFVEDDPPNKDHVKLLIEGEQFSFPKENFKNCKIFDDVDVAANLSLELHDVTVSQFEKTFEFLNFIDDIPTLVQKVSEFCKNFKSSVIDLLITSEVLRIPELFVLSLDYFHSSQGNVSECIKVACDSFLQSKMTISDWVDLEDKFIDLIPIFDLLWFTRCVVTFPELIGYSGIEPPLERLLSKFSEEQGEWSFTFASLWLSNLCKTSNFELSDADFAVLEKVGDRIFTLNFASFDFVDVSNLSSILYYCPNILTLNLKNSCFDDSHVDVFLNYCDILKEVDVVGSKISQKGVEALKTSFPSIYIRFNESS